MFKNMHNSKGKHQQDGASMMLQIFQNSSNIILVIVIPINIPNHFRVQRSSCIVFKVAESNSEVIIQFLEFCNKSFLTFCGIFEFLRPMKTNNRLKSTTKAF